MGKARIATGVLLVTLVTGAMGYTIASAVLTYQDLGFGAEIDFAYMGFLAHPAPDSSSASSVLQNPAQNTSARKSSPMR